RELISPSLIYILVGLLGVAALSVVLPFGSLQTAAEHDDIWAPLFMALVAIPAYATPMTAMVQLASMFQHGNSVGAAFALLALGAGANLGLVTWTIRSYGFSRGLVWFGILVAVVIALSYGVDQPLYPHGVEPAGHTHAFDIYCCPFPDGTTASIEAVVGTLREKLAPHELVALGLAGALLVVGLALRRWDPRGKKVEAWLERAPDVRPRYDVVIPGPVLGLVALVGLIAASVFGCYLYYPPPSEIFEEMRLIHVEVAAAATSQDWDTALYWIPIFDDWTRKLQVSVVLRGGDLTDYHRMKAAVLRDKLELLEHEVEDREVEEARKLALAVNRAYRRMRAAFEG
ncbi:MAG: permease, partial [Pirellulaceae bacterium]